jgi:hypothetical protein
MSMHAQECDATFQITFIIIFFTKTREFILYKDCIMAARLHTESKNPSMGEKMPELKSN